MLAQMPTSATDHLADNIKAIRETRGLSQQQIAKAAGIPRATWTNLESGAANPTLAVLVKVAAALEVRLDELLAPPRQPARFLRADELPTRQRGQVAIRKLLPEPLPNLDLERMTLPPARAWPACRTRRARASTSRASKARSSSRSPASATRSVRATS